MNAYIQFRDFVGEILETEDPTKVTDEHVYKFLIIVFEEMSSEQFESILAILIRSGYLNKKWLPHKIFSVISKVEEEIFNKYIPQYEIITTRQVSSLLHISERTIIKQTRKYDLPFHLLPNSRHRRFNLKEIYLWAKLHDIPVDLEYLDKLIQGVV